MLECGHCHKQYISNIADVANLNGVCSSCGYARQAKTRQTYRVGEIIYSKNELSFYFKQELPPVYANGHKRRRGIFFLIDDKTYQKIGKEFGANLVDVCQGDVTGKNFSSGMRLVQKFLDENAFKYEKEATLSDLLAPDTQRQ